MKSFDAANCKIKMAMSKGWIARGGHISKLKWSILNLAVENDFRFSRGLFFCFFLSYFFWEKWENARLKLMAARVMGGYIKPKLFMYIYVTTMAWISNDIG